MRRYGVKEMWRYGGKEIRRCGDKEETFAKQIPTLLNREACSFNYFCRNDK